MTMRILKGNIEEKKLKVQKFHFATLTFQDICRNKKGKQKFGK